MEIDLNADLGEGAGFDAELMPLVTSANVCCGAHAGDIETTRATLELAKRHGVSVGAHPGYNDRENFGRRDQSLVVHQVFALCADQVRRLLDLAIPQLVHVKYLKPHGALYNQAGRDPEYAEGVVRAAETHQLLIVGLPGSEMERVAGGRVPFIPEGFADRRYRPDGSLVPRTEPDAFVHDPDEAVRQVEWLIREKGVRTICVHGDNPQAVAFTRAVRAALLARGFVLRPFA
ncbi:MAG: LamB/YcsF family protein [Gemmataceae bacterium]|nr:LamB/YcsF family protein [Gemmataceae bacterium]